MTDYHPGLDGVIATESSISDIDGKRGILSYRGYSIEELAKKSTFEETSYLLLVGELPTKSELVNFTNEININRNLPEQLLSLLKNLPKNSNPMDVLQIAVSSLGPFYPIEFDPQKLLSKKYERAHFLHISARLIGSVGSIIAGWNRIREDKPCIPAQNELSYAENFLIMLDDKRSPSVLVKTIMDASLVLHGEHTINASTFTAMVTASTFASPTQVMASAIGSLSGPLHGGANQKVVKMLNEIGSAKNVKTWLDDTLEKKQIVWGMGHREYSVKDPRANILTGLVQELFKEQSGKVSEMFETAMELEKQCENKLSKKGVYANVDFYSGILYKEIGIPVDLFTTIFAIARTSGWLAHWIEQINNNKLFRPTQIYNGPNQRTYVSINDR